jgi:hypothetical protein
MRGIPQASNILLMHLLSQNREMVYNWSLILTEIILKLQAIIYS